MNPHTTVYHAWLTVQTIFPTMSRPKTKQLARFAHGLCLAQNCQLPQVAAALTDHATAAAHERCCQRFLSQGPLRLTAAQQDLTRWLLSVLPLPPRLTLLVDETALGNHLRVLVVALAFQGRALPLAWACYPPETEGQTERVLALLDALAPALPARRPVLVQADRGIGGSPTLLEGIAARGWYFLMRVQASVRLRLDDGREVVFEEQVQRGEQWAGSVEAFKKAGWLPCRALAWWRADAEEPWLLVTNHPSVTAAEYGVRMWEEAAFRDLKSGGWPWQRSRVWLPERAARLWLVLALASAWMVVCGLWVLSEAGSAWRRGVVRGEAGRLSVFQVGLRVYRYWVWRGFGGALWAAWGVWWSG